MKTNQHPSPRSFSHLSKQRLGFLPVLVQEVEHGRMMRNEVEPRTPVISVTLKRHHHMEIVETNGESVLKMIWGVVAAVQFTMEN